MSTHQSTVPQAAARYFSAVLPLEHDVSTDRSWPQVAGYHYHPTIAQTFTPDRGWTSYGGRKRISLSWARKLRAEGVTHIALQVGNRVADFSIKELAR